MTVKSLLTSFLFLISVIAFGQSSVDFGHLVNSWTQGKVDPIGTVVQADESRGGWYNLIINPDATVLFLDAFTCGFGHKRGGEWQLNTSDSTVTFKFFTKTGYLNVPGTENISETEIYEIQKLTANELILTRIEDGREITKLFIKQ